MRPLNRPMFRYGGPIKEGIMQGMQDGGLANNEGPRRAALVGNPVYPKGPDGRTGHFVPVVVGGLSALARFAPAAIRGIRAARAYKPFSQNLGFTGRLKDILTPRGPLRADPKAVGPTGPMQILPGEGVGFKFGSLLRRNPLTLGLPAASLGAEAVVGAAKMVPDFLRAYGNQIIPFVDPFTKKDDDIKTTGEGEIIRGGKTTKVIPEGEVEAGTGKESKVSAAEKAKLNEDRIQETKNKYYKMMGIDKMNKEAVYDSLIDASKIIQEEGGDLKGSVKSGTLQNRLIQAIGKNLDKSADLKKAIDSAILKGEIQKDINLTKPSAFAEQVEYIRNNPNDPLAKKLSGMRSVADDLALMVDKPITSETVLRSVQSKGTKVTDMVKDDKYQKWEKNNEGKDEIDYVQENLKGIDDGIYIINKKAIQIQTIDGKKVANPLDLDSIIG
jgi:hypothetical protein